MPYPHNISCDYSSIREICKFQFERFHIFNSRDFEFPIRQILNFQFERFHFFNSMDFEIFSTRCSKFVAVILLLFPCCVFPYPLPLFFLGKLLFLPCIFPLSCLFLFTKLCLCLFLHRSFFLNFFFRICYFGEGK